MTLCQKHYAQMRYYGKILERTKFDKNEIIVNDDFAEVLLYDNKHQRCARVKIDIEDIDKIKDFKWCHSGSGYAKTDIKVNGKKKPLFMHRLILNCPDDLYIDHISQNCLDNRKCNLRICNWQQNNWNKTKQINNTSGFKGVTKFRNKWMAQITVNKKHINLGRFNSPKEASEAYERAAEKYFGEFAYKEVVDE
jgi:hypothetical protein